MVDVNMPTKPYEKPVVITAPKGFYLLSIEKQKDAEKIEKATDLRAHAKMHYSGKVIDEFIFTVPDSMKDKIENILNPPEPKKLGRPPKED